MRARGLVAALLPLIFLSLAARPGTALTLFEDAGQWWVGGTDKGRPFIERWPGERWRGTTPGAVHMLAHGRWTGSLEGDAALVWIDAKGRPRRTLRFGGPLYEEAIALVPQGNRTYLAGQAEGRFFGPNHGGQDVFLAWVEDQTLQGALTWGTDDDDVLTAAAPAPDGALYLAGYQMTNEDCIRVAERGFILRFEPGVGIRWAYRFSFEASSRPTTILADARGLWVAGNTDGPLFGEARGGDDVFVLRLSPRGEVQSSTQWGSDLSDLAVAWLKAPEGGRVLLIESAGAFFGSGGDFAPVLVRLDAQGQPLDGVRLAVPRETPHPVAALRRGDELWLLLNGEGGHQLLTRRWPLR